MENEVQPAINSQLGTGDVICRIGTKKSSSSAHVLDGGKPSQGTFFTSALDFLSGEILSFTRGIRPAWRDHVDPNAMRTQLVGNDVGHVVDTRFGNVVRLARVVLSVALEQT